MHNLHGHFDETPSTPSALDTGALYVYIDARRGSNLAVAGILVRRLEEPARRRRSQRRAGKTPAVPAKSRQDAGGPSAEPARRGLEPAMAPIELLNEVLDRPEHTGLRRALALWLTQVHLRSRLPGVTVPPVEKLEEVKPMIEANAIDWTIPWQEEGRKKGLQEGRKKGLREGRREGEAALLLRQLTRRFGPLSPAVQERVRDADADQLLVWGERFVTATELDEVFEALTWRSPRRGARGRATREQVRRVRRPGACP